jgi:hypothetical protein
MSSLPLSTGELYEVNIVGIDQKIGNIPFGNIGNTRVYIDPPNDDIIVKPGDTYKVRITGIRENTAIGKYIATAEPLENCRCFLDYKTYLVKLTGQNYRDARHAVSDPALGGGIYGVFTVVNNVKFINNTLTYEVTPKVIGEGKNKRYYIISELNDPSLGRTGDEIFFVIWDSKTMGNPSLKSARRIFGVPKELKIALYLRNSEIGKILHSKSPDFDISSDTTSLFRTYLENVENLEGDNPFRLAILDDHKSSYKAFFKEAERYGLILEELKPEFKNFKIR